MEGKVKNRIFKIAWLSILVVALFSGISFAGTWVKTGSLWRYRVGKHFYRNQWAEIGGEWYYFKPTGSMAKQEWVEQQGSWYYLLPNGTMAKNQWIDDYYLLGDGSMARNQEIDGKYLGEDGKRDQAQEQAMAEAARQAKIQEAKNKGYLVIQGRMKIWNVVEWRNAGHDVNAINMYLKGSKEFSKYNFAVVDFVKPERVFLENADGSPGQYVMKKNISFTVEDDFMKKYGTKSGQIVDIAFYANSFWSPSDVSIPLEYDYADAAFIIE